MLKVLYVKRDDFNNLLKKRNLRKLIYQYRTRDDLVGQNGFFEGALYSAFDVTEVTWPDFQTLTQKTLKNYDALIINQKSGITPEEAGPHLSGLSSIPKLYFASGAKAHKLPSNKFLDNFDLIFKREPFKDLGKYEHLSKVNRDKIKPTMLACPLIKLKKTEAKNYKLVLPDRRETIARQYDTSFAGKGTSIQRYDICNHLTEFQDLNYYFTLFDPQNKVNPAYISPSINTTKLSQKKYVELVKQTRVNLALEGFGQFTHRHLELWYLGAFMLSSPSIKEIQLPQVEHEENKHYAVFDNPEDLVEKIDYYLKQDKERNKIAQAGQDLFRKLYDFKKYGQFIKQSITDL